jgi:hypothetical protein
MILKNYGTINILSYSKTPWNKICERMVIMTIGNPNDKSTMKGVDRRLI